MFAVSIVSPTYSVPSVRPWRAMEGQGPSSVSAWDDIGSELPIYNNRRIADEKAEYHQFGTAWVIRGRIVAVVIVLVTILCCR